MKKRNSLYLLIPFILGAILVGCNNTNEDINDDNSSNNPFTLTFNKNFNGSSAYEIEVPSGHSLEDVLTNNEKTELDNLTAGDSTHNFEGWYTSAYGANNLDDDYYFDFSSEISADLYLFAGYTDSSINERVEEFVQNYLGVYQEFDIDPFPLMDALSFTYDDEEGRSFTYTNVSSHSLEKYYSSLQGYYGFTKVDENKYLSKEGYYYVSYSYDSSFNELEVNIEFADNEGSFPTYFFASNFYGLDISCYLNEINFNYASMNVDSENRYLTYALDESGVRNTYIFFEPSSNYYEILEDIGDLFEDCYLEYDETSGLYFDTYSSAYVSLDYVSEEEVSTFARYGLDLSTSMIKIQGIQNTDRTSLDEDTLESLITYLYGSDGLSIFPYIIEADAYSDLYISGSSSYYIYYAPLYYAIGVDLDYLELYIGSLEGDGWDIYESSYTTYRAFTISSPTYEYQISLYIYEGDNFVDINTNVVRVSFIRNASAFDYLNNFIYNQTNNGTCGYASIPTFPAKRFTRGSSTYETAGYYIIGYQSTLEVYNQFIDDLENEGCWTNLTKSTYDATYESTDGYFSLTITYRGGNIRADLIYNTQRKVESIEQAETLITQRLTYGMNSTVLNSLNDSGYNSLELLSYYDGYYQRAGIFFYYSTEASTLEAYNIVSQSLEDNLTYRSASSVTFYEDDNGLVYYAYYEEYLDGYVLGLISYNPGV